MASTLDVVFFTLRGLRCALPARLVRAVLPSPSLTPVPLAPSVLRGIAPLKGQILPVLDLGVWFQSASNDANEDREFHLDGDHVLLIETEADALNPSVRAALAVEATIQVGVVDEAHSRPAPPRPTFISSTVLDNNGPALLINMPLALDRVRDAISENLKP